MNASLKHDIAKLKTGDKSEYEKIFHEFYGVLFSLGKQYLMDGNEAEEIVQNAFLKLWEMRSEISDQSNIRNFLYTLVKNNCLNQLRNKQNEARLIKNYHYFEWQYNYEALAKTSDSYVQFKELKEKVDLAICNLPDDLRVVFEMNRFQDMRYKDIAMKLDISEKTVEARMSKALRILRAELKDYLPMILFFSNLLN